MHPLVAVSVIKVPVRIDEVRDAICAQCRQSLRDLRLRCGVTCIHQQLALRASQHGDVATRTHQHTDVAAKLLGGDFSSGTGRPPLYDDRR